MVGNLGGFGITLPGVAVCEAQASHYEPFFTVDISDLATPNTPLADTNRGEAMDVNDDGFAVGWYEDATDSNNEKPFFMTPVDGGSASPLDLGSFSVGHAIAISETTGYDLTGAIIAGWVDSTSGHQAVYWTWDGIQWNINVVFNPIKVSESQAITWSGLIAGFYVDTSQNPDENRVFYYDPVSQITTPLPGNFDAGAYAARDDTNQTTPIAIAGFVNLSSNSHGFFFDASGGVDLHSALPANIYDDSVAFAMNSTDDVVGYASGVTGSPPMQFSDAVYWSPSGSGWNAVILQTAKPDPIDSAVAAITERSTLNGDEIVDIVGDYSTNSEKGVFYVVYDRTQAMYASYKLEPTTGTNQHPSLAMFPLASRTTGKTYSANGINNRSAIAGSYKPDKSVLGNAGFRPCLYVPNDFDNDKVPDIRQILWSKMRISPDFDQNNNWLLDSVEQMRVGLFGPGADGATSKTDQIVNVQAIRLMGYTQGKLNNILTDPNGECADQAGYFDHWGFDNNSEIILNSRTVDRYPNFYPDFKFDHLLDSNDKITNLNTIRTFAFRFARCIDGMQFGNEMFTGPGQYYFHMNELSSDPGFDGSIKDIRDAVVFDEAVNLAFAQIGDQGEAARIGSALAGRPLRIFSPAISLGFTKAGYCGTVKTGGGLDPDNNYSATAIFDLVNFANANRLIFDQHTNYSSLDDLKNRVDMIRGVFVDPVCGQNPPWGTGPDFIASLENGPMPGDGWWTQKRQDDALKYYPPNSCGTGSNAWVDFVNGWKDTDILLGGFGGTFPLYDVFQKASDSSFMYMCVNTLQQGTKIDNKNNEFVPKTELGMLRAKAVSPSCVSQQTDKFMPIKDVYQIDAAGFQVPNFNPHPESCNSAVVCPN